MADSHEAKSPHLSRRGILAGGVAGLAAAATTAAAQPTRNATFPQGVASGDPLADAVIIWTRALPSQDNAFGDDLTVAWEIAETESFTAPVTSAP